MEWIEENADSTIFYYKKSLETWEKLGNKKSMAALIHNIGLLYVVYYSDEKKGIGLLSITIVTIISLIALLIILDTFKIYIISFIPNIDFYLSSLYESLKDIFLFFKDLIK